ncbi:MAG: zinc ribbon domain-containing protein [Xanthomonadales bacterium]|nr:zinc ribbon domain-containing protein [Xanthomonadales bacterium]
MPIYEYAACDPQLACTHCRVGFEVFARISDAELRQCPQSGLAVRRVISAAAVVSGSAHLQQEAHFSKRGFTQYRKAGGGIYEKTAGDGPQYIGADGKQA